MGIARILVLDVGSPDVDWLGRRLPTCLDRNGLLPCASFLLHSMPIRMSVGG